ncbi:MAG: hypothetical protein EAS48_09280 [Chryseobacterium sp.]|nr:MAG: hypothetical protein EAS48_09280 [Chryseobacterium sp.]
MGKKILLVVFAILFIFMIVDFVKGIAGIAKYFIYGGLILVAIVYLLYNNLFGSRNPNNQP